jgi:hypothetical protein
MDTKVSLHDGDGNDDSTSGIEEAAEASVQTTGDEVGLIQSNKDSKRKSPPPNSIQIPMIQLEAKKEIVTKTTKTESDPQRHHPR